MALRDKCTLVGVSSGDLAKSLDRTNGVRVQRDMFVNKDNRPSKTCEFKFIYVHLSAFGRTFCTCNFAHEINYEVFDMMGVGRYARASCMLRPQCVCVCV